MNASPLPPKISSPLSRVSLQCRVLNPIQKMICFFSHDAGITWFSLEMASLTDNEFNCEVPIESKNSEVIFFLQLITLEGRSIIENNKGVLFQFRVDEEHKEDQENTTEFKTTDESGPFHDNKLVNPSVSSSQVNLSHISSNNPFSSPHQAKSPQIGKKIIKFNIQSDSFVDNPSEINQEDRSADVSSSTNSCSKCHGRFPKFLKICPYCGEESS